MAAAISRRFSSNKSNFVNSSLSAYFFSIATPTSRIPSLRTTNLVDLCLPNLDLISQKPNLLNMRNPPSTYFIGAQSTRIHKACEGYRYLSTNPVNEAKDAESKLEGFKHQEIEGPTVERDMSSLANETREVTEKLMKNMYGASRVIGMMSVVQLGLGAWISYSTRSAPVLEMTLMSAVAFGFPLSMALMLRWSVKPMHFFRKMEELGRLQILTATMQMAKHLNLFFFRLQGVSYLCIAGLCTGTLVLFFVR